MTLETEVCKINVLNTTWFPNWDGSSFVFAIKINNDPWLADDICYYSLIDIAKEIFKKIKGRRINYEIISNNLPLPEINNRYFNKKGLPPKQDLSKYYTEEGNREDFPSFVDIRTITDKNIEYLRKFLFEEKNKPK